MWIAPATIGPRRLRVDGVTYERTGAPVEAIVDHGVAMVMARYRDPAGEPVALLRGVGADEAGPVIVAGGFLILM